MNLKRISVIAIVLMFFPSTGQVELKDNLVWDSLIDEMSRPVIGVSSSNVYVEPDTNSRVITKLKINFKIEVQRQGSNSQGKWYQVIFEKGEQGFISKEDVASYSFQGKGGASYLVKKESYPLIMYKIGVSDAILDTLFIKNSGNKIQLIDTLNLINVDAIFLFTEYQEYCGGATVYKYLIDANNNLSELIEHRDYMDDGPEEYTLSSNVRLLDQGEVILSEREDWIATDKNNELIKMGDGSYKYDSKDSTSIFQWNGSDLKVLP